MALERQVGGPIAIVIAALAIWAFGRLARVVSDEPSGQAESAPK